MFNFLFTKTKPLVKNKEYLQKKQLKFIKDNQDILEYSNKLINSINMAKINTNRNLLEEYLIHIIFLINYNLDSDLISKIALQNINKYKIPLEKILELLSINDRRYISILLNIISMLSGTSEIYTSSIHDIRNFSVSNYNMLLDLLISDEIYGIDLPIRNKYLKYKYKYYALQNKIDAEQRINL